MNVAHFGLALRLARHHERFLKRITRLHYRLQAPHISGHAPSVAKAPPYKCYHPHPFLLSSDGLCDLMLRVYARGMLLVLGSYWALTLGVTAAENHFKGDSLKDDMLGCLLLPLMSVWSVAPLVYYVILLHLLARHLHNLRLKLASVRKPKPCFLRHRRHH